MEMYEYDDFYDMIIDIRSMNSLLEDGWEEDFSDKGLMRYNEKKDKPSVLISVFGNHNTGKSFILSKISEITFPCGYSIFTTGLSIRYPSIKNQNFIFLDSSGFNQSLVENDIYKLYKDNLSEKEYIEKMNTITSDRLLTEYFILNFILYYSNIPILVLEELSFSQQELYDKAKKLLYGNQLFVIHNLRNIEKIERVKEFIKDIFECSITFNLKENYLNINEDTKFKNYVYHLEEINNENGKKNIIHLIMARDGTEAGEYYNTTTIHFLRQIMNTYCNRQTFPIEKRLKEFLFKISNNIMEKPIDNINQIIIKDKLVRLTYEKDKKLKFKIYNEIIFSEQLMGNKYIPKYYYYKSQDGRFLFIELIICGDIINLKNKIDLLNNFYYFHYEGEKSINIENPKESEIIGFSKKKERFFNFDIKIPITEIFLKEYKIYSKKFEYGILTLSYELFNREKNDNEFDIKF